MAGLVPADTLKDYIGKDMGASDWLKVDQYRIINLLMQRMTINSFISIQKKLHHFLAQQ